MPQIPLYTYQDLMQHLTDFLGANPSAEAQRDARKAIQQAHRVFASAHQWSFYYQRGRLVTQPMASAGTISYTAANRTAVLAGATFPDYAPFCTILIQSIEYQVASMTDSQTLVLASGAAPAADLPAGTPYMLYRDTYPLPADFGAMDELINATYVLGLEYIHPNAWLSRHRLVYTPSTPYRYTITGDPHYFGSMCVRFFPAPDTVYNMDYIYRRRPRPLAFESYSTGLVSVVNGNNLVAGSGGAAFSANMVGSVIRFGFDAKTPPTGITGSNPYQYERVITSVQDATDVFVDAVLDGPVTNVKYTVSDPLDIEDGAMLTAFLRCCEWQMARARHMKDRAEIEQEYRQALTLAEEADSRSFQSRVAGQQPANALRLAYMPRGPDIG